MESANQFSLLPPGGLSPPKGLNAAMEGLVREVLLKNPKDIYEFAANYFEKLIELRRTAGSGENEEINNLIYFHQQNESPNGTMDHQDNQSIDSSPSQKLIIANKNLNDDIIIPENLSRSNSTSENINVNDELIKMESTIPIGEFDEMKHFSENGIDRKNSHDNIEIFDVENIADIGEDIGNVDTPDDVFDDENKSHVEVIENSIDAVDSDEKLSNIVDANSENNDVKFTDEILHIENKDLEENYTEVVEIETILIDGLNLENVNETVAEVSDEKDIIILENDKNLPECIIIDNITEDHSTLEINESSLKLQLAVDEVNDEMLQIENEIIIDDNRNLEITEIVECQHTEDNDSKIVSMETTEEPSNNNCDVSEIPSVETNKESEKLQLSAVDMETVIPSNVLSNDCNESETIIQEDSSEKESETIVQEDSSEKSESVVAEEGMNKQELPDTKIDSNVYISKEAGQEIIKCDEENIVEEDIEKKSNEPVSEVELKCASPNIEKLTINSEGLDKERMLEEEFIMDENNIPNEYDLKITVENKSNIGNNLEKMTIEEINNKINNDENVVLQKSVTVIQKVFRGFLTRKKLATLFKNKKSDFSKEELNKKIENDLLGEAPPPAPQDNFGTTVTSTDPVLYTVPEEKNDSSSTEDESSTFSSAATKIQAGVRGYLTRKYFQLNKTFNSSDTTAPSIGEDSKSFEDIAANLESDEAVSKIIVATSSLLIEQLEHFEKLEQRSSSANKDTLDVNTENDDNFNRGRKKLRREDAIQLNSPCSSDETPNNKYASSPGKISEDEEPIGDLANSIITEIIQNVKDDTEIKDDSTTTVENESQNIVISNDDKNDDTVPEQTAKHLITQNESVQSDDCDVVSGPIIASKIAETENNTTASDLDTQGIMVENDEIKEVAKSKNPDEIQSLLHSGEFHDTLVLPTKIMRQSPTKSKD